MPTVLDRTTITHTPPVDQLLSAAAKTWPDVDSDRELMLRLMQEGASALRHRELRSAYEQAYLEWDGSPDAELWDTVSGDGLKDEQ